MRYFECLGTEINGWDKSEIGIIFPENHDFEGDSIAVRLTYQPHVFKERTEAEYLAQQNAPTLGEIMHDKPTVFGIPKSSSPINDYHAALDAIGQGRIKEIPQNIFDAILKEFVDEDKRRWALQNGFVEG